MARAVGDLSSSLEDYLETILVLSREKKVVRVRDIADHMKVAMSSVNGALKRLADEGLVKHERYEFVELSGRGSVLARKILERHNLLTHFLQFTLHVEAATAEKDACAIEHYLSQQTIERILDFFFYIEVCPKGAETWKKFYEECLAGKCDMDTCSLRKLWPEGRHLLAAGKSGVLTLRHIRPGFSARIVSVNQSESAGRRLSEMGLNPGVLVEIRRSSQGQGEIEASVGNAIIHLDSVEAGLVLVDLT